jgi:hypothetical protein
MDQVPKPPTAAQTYEYKVGQVVLACQHRTWDFGKVVGLTLLPDMYRVRFEGDRGRRPYSAMVLASKMKPVGGSGPHSNI